MAWVALIGFAVINCGILSCGNSGKPADEPIVSRSDLPVWATRKLMRNYEVTWIDRVDSQNAEILISDPRLVFIGDSITDGMRNTGLEMWNRYYAPRRALNLGIFGDRTEYVLWRLRRAPLEHIHPEAVVILIGINDLRSSKSPLEVAAGVMEVAGCVKKQIPSAHRIILSIFPSGKFPGPLRDRISETNRIIAQHSTGQGMTFLDIGDRFLQPDGTISEDIMPDYLHPTPRGYRIWAEALEPALEKILGPLGSAPVDSGDH